MKTALAFALFAVTIACSAFAQAPRDPKLELTKLADTERAFASKSVAEGMRAAFLEYFAADGINFTPHPVNTRESLSSRPAPASRPPITLDWWPAFGDISLAGDLGYTTGPFSLTDSRENDKVVGHGYYFSIWKRQPDGSWRVAIDYGAQTPKAGSSKAATTFRASRWVGNKVKSVSSDAPGILAREQQFSEGIARSGLLPAYQSFTSWDNETRLYRDQSNPIIGRSAVRAYLTKSWERRSWQTIASDMASSRDLGYSYGKWNDAADPSKSGYYVRVWRFIGGAWRVVIEVMNPLPAQ